MTNRSTVGQGMMYPATVTTDANGTVTEMEFHCSAHGEPVPCIDCDNAEVAAFQDADTYTAYLGYSGRFIATFSGAILAKVTESRLGRRRYTPTGGSYRMRYVRAVSHNGRVHWYGFFNDDSGNAVKLYRSKATGKESQ